MITLTKQNGEETYGLVEITVDTVSDIEYLPVSCLPGSVAFVIETSDVYMLSGQGKWVKI